MTYQHPCTYIFDLLPADRRSDSGIKRANS